MNRINFFIVIFVLLLYPYPIFGQVPSEEWIKRYSSASAADMTVDTDGNAYIVGTSGSEIITMKYDTEGNEIWERSHQGGASPSAIAIATDSAKNVYLAGKDNGAVLIKYDANGTEKWVRMYEGVPIGIFVDPLSNIYVCETSRMIKYDADGNVKWVQELQPWGYAMNATAFTVDSQGNSYLTGTVNSNSWDWNDILTVKYDANGTLQWVKRYNGVPIGTWQNDLAKAIAVDLSGNVYVTGATQTTIYGGNWYDYVTIKYDRHGNEKWVKKYDNGDYWQGDIANAIATDSLGNVYITGWSAYSSATIKYDSNGNQLWVKRYREGIEFNPKRLVVDSSANVYVAGDHNRVDGYDFRIIKYDSDGNELWVESHDEGGQEGYVAQFTVDSTGNMYVTGTFINYAIGSSIVNVKYNPLSSPKPISSLYAFDTPCDNGGRLTLNWALSPDDPKSGTGNNTVIGYNIYRALSSGGPYEIVGNTVSGVGSYVDNKADIGITYYYVVKATDGSKESVSSSEISAFSLRNLPLPPTNLAASETPFDLGGSITLSWNKSVDDGGGLNNLSAYNIYRYSSTNGNTAFITSITSGSVGYIDSKTSDVDTYFYFIKSLSSNCNIESPASVGVQGQSQNNLYALTGVIQGLPGISSQIMNSLITKVDNAIASFEGGNSGASINGLNALLNEIAAQSGKGIDSTTAGYLTTYIQHLTDIISNH